MSTEDFTNQVYKVLDECYSLGLTAYQIGQKLVEQGITVTNQQADVNHVLYDNISQCQVMCDQSTYPPTWFTHPLRKKALETAILAQPCDNTIIVIDLDMCSTIGMLDYIEPYCSTPCGTESGQPGGILQVWAFSNKESNRGYPLSHKIRVWKTTDADVLGPESLQDKTTQITYRIAAVAASTFPGIILHFILAVYETSGYTTLKTLIESHGHTCQLTPSWKVMRNHIE